ncbi:MAG: hypothetical protein E3J72_05245 [Planctomycetota bacterium]|nr:MAG: hypothetical protein E3J72_05245 [Planctomycetota bacterium]
MSVLARVFVILNFVLAIVYLSVAATLYHHKFDWRMQFQKIKYDYVEMKNFYKSQLRTRGEIINSYKDYLEMKEHQVSLLELAMQNIASDLEVALVHEATVKQDLVTVLNQHTKALMILSEKDNIIDEITKARDSFHRQFTIALKEKDTAENQVAALTRVVTDQHRDLAEVRQYLTKIKRERNDLRLQIEALRRIGIPVEMLAKRGAMPQIDAVVTSYKEPVRLVVLNVGSEHGVRTGFYFTIFDGGNFVAQVEVEKVMPRLCGTRVIFSTGPIREGMQATTRLY